MSGFHETTKGSGFMAMSTLRDACLAGMVEHWKGKE